MERCDESSELAAPSGRRGEGAWRALLIAGTLLGSGLGMQVMHELGHVLGAWLTGGEVWRVVLHPLSISRTDLGANPHPLAVVWAGPMLGVAIPGLLWGAAAGLQTAWSRRRRARRERGGGAVGFALVWTCLARSRKTTADLPCAPNSRTMVTQPLRAEPNLVRTGICGARKG